MVFNLKKSLLSFHVVFFMVIAVQLENSSDYCYVNNFFNIISLSIAFNRFMLYNYSIA